MLRAHRLSAVRICLLITGVMLLSAIAVALAASADPSWAAGKKASSARHGKCAAAARAGKHRKARKACAFKKARGAKPGISRWRTERPFSPSIPSTGTEAPVNGGAPPTVASKEPGSEAGSFPEPPSGSGSSPVAPTSPVEPIPPAEPVGPVEATAPFRFFSSASFWNEPVPANAPLDPSSAAVVGAFDELVAEEERSRGGGPWINTTSYSVPVYTVPGDQHAVSVTLQDYVPNNAALSSAWSAVPLPPDAHPAAGTDVDLVVWQPSTERLWEFWRLVHKADGWYASWGGAMQNVSSDSGVYGQEVWPGAKPQWGVAASSLSLVGGLISLEDLQLGEINHAVSMSIPNVRAGVYASPAQRDDGKSTDPFSLPEGAHLRLNPKLNLAALHLPRLTLMIAEAAQRYGIFVRDGAQVVTFQAQDPTPTGTNPYVGVGGYFEGKYPRELLTSFPWSQLELLKMELHSGA